MKKYLIISFLLCLLVVVPSLAQTTVTADQIIQAFIASPTLLAEVRALMSGGSPSTVTNTTATTTGLLWTFISAPTPTVTVPSYPGAASSSLVGSITFKVNAASGNVLVRPTINDFIVGFSSSSPSQYIRANWDRGTSVLIDSISPTASSISDGSAYTLTIRGVLLSGNSDGTPNLSGSANYYMAIKQASAIVNNQRFSTSTDFRTPSAYLPVEGSTPPGLPDLTVENLVLSGSTIVAQVCNRGAVGASNFYGSFYAGSWQPSPSSPGHYFSLLAPGNCTEALVGSELITNYGSTVTFKVDYDNRVMESNESNNQLTRVFATTTPQLSNCAKADVNGTGKVDNFDILFVRGQFGCGISASSTSCSKSDLNGDGKVDNFDILFIRGQFGCSMITAAQTADQNNQLAAVLQALLRFSGR